MIVQGEHWGKPCASLQVKELCHRHPQTSERSCTSSSTACKSSMQATAYYSATSDTMGNRAKKG